MIIGITGSSGAGKSTVCEILERDYKAIILNADKIAKRLSKKGTEYYKDIVEEFGDAILREDGEINRRKLAKIIYKDKEARETLNKCTFKYINKEIELERIKIENAYVNLHKMKLEDVKKKVIIAIDAPLLFEAKLDQMCEYVIAVISKNNELQIQRIMERDCITKEDAISRLEAQQADNYYIQKSDYVIVNDGEISKVEEQIKQILGVL